MSDKRAKWWHKNDEPKTEADDVEAHVLGEDDRAVLGEDDKKVLGEDAPSAAQ
jgi:hypothetical protein